MADQLYEGDQDYRAPQNYAYLLAFEALTCVLLLEEFEHDTEEAGAELRVEQLKPVLLSRGAVVHLNLFKSPLFPFLLIFQMVSNSLFCGLVLCGLFCPTFCLIKVQF